MSGAVALVILWMATRKTDLTALVGGGKISAAGWQTLATYGIFLAAMFVLVASIYVGRRRRCRYRPRWKSGSSPAERWWPPC